MANYRALDVSPQSFSALERMIQSRGPEPLRDLLTEIHDMLLHGQDITVQPRGTGDSVIFSKDIDWDLWDII